MSDAGERTAAPAAYKKVNCRQRAVADRHVAPVLSGPIKSLPYAAAPTRYKNMQSAYCPHNSMFWVRTFRFWTEIRIRAFHSTRRMSITYSRQDKLYEYRHSKVTAVVIFELFVKNCNSFHYNLWTCLSPVAMPDLAPCVPGLSNVTGQS
jgi:hypothetical protein